MKLKYITFALILSTVTLSAQSVLGTWKTIDDDSGEAKSHVVIYEENGKIFGKVTKILNPEARYDRCKNCKGEDKNVKILGMTIIKDLEKDGDEYADGTITDPENGKEYRSKIWLDDNNPNLLNVRGYVAFLYRTQQWVRLE